MNWKSEIGRFWPKSLGYSPFENGGKYWDSFLPESPPTCLQMDFQLFSTMLVKISGQFRRVRNRPILKCISNYFRQCWWRFRVNSEGSEIGRFWPKSLGYSPWFWKWRIWVSVGIRSKLPKSPPTCLKIRFQLLSTMLVKIMGEFQRVRNRPILTKKPGL